MMNKILICLLIFFPVSPIFAEADSGDGILELRVGDRAEKVTEVMGKPKGMMESGDFGIYYYKLGNVQMKSGIVTALNLISEQAWQEQQQAQAAAQEARRKQGETVLKSIEADPKFEELPAATRLAFWEKFQKDYPNVDVYVHYSKAKIEVDKATEDARDEQRIADLERRVQNAENEARRAAQVAKTQRAYAQSRAYSNRYPPVIVYPQSYIIRNTPRQARSYTRNRISYPGQGINLNIGLNSRQSSTTTTTSGFVNGQNGVMRIQSSEGFVRDFY